MNGISRVAGSRGERRVNADAAAAHVDANTGNLVVALADGIGDHAGAARAAVLAARAAVSAPSAAGPAAALAAAQWAVLADRLAGDCVLVVAQQIDDGYRIGWVGDVRAYAWQSGELRQLTTDHTVAQYFRDHGKEPARGMEHLVTTSVRTSPPARFGTAMVGGPVRLLLLSDGVHKTVSATTIANLVRYAENPAAALVEAAGGGDNATALVVDPAPVAIVPATVPIAA